MSNHDSMREIKAKTPELSPEEKILLKDINMGTVDSFYLSSDECVSISKLFKKLATIKRLEAYHG